MLSSNIGVDERGRLTFAGMDTVDLAKKYKTPLYLMDEDKIREVIKEAGYEVTGITQE